MTLGRLCAQQMGTPLTRQLWLRQVLLEEAAAGASSFNQLPVEQPASRWRWSNTVNFRSESPNSG